MSCKTEDAVTMLEEVLAGNPGAVERAKTFVAAVRPTIKPTRSYEGVPTDYKGSELEGLVQRAGRIIECGFHVFTFRRKSDGRWMNMLVLEDMDGKEFCHAFEFDGEASHAMMAYLLRGVKEIERQEAAAPRA